MAAITNTFQTTDAVGIREDLSDVIYRIDPTETPFVTGAGRGKITQTLYEWQIDSLDAPDGNNAQAEGDDVTSFPAITPTVRLQNRAQISRKHFIISDTEEAVDKAGRKSELAYQRAKKSLELKRDIETIALSNQAAATGPRKTGALGAWVKSNTDKEGTGTDPVYTTIADDPRNDGTQRPFTEAMLKSVIQKGYAAGAKFKTLMVGVWNKQVASGFAGVASKVWNMSTDAAATTVAAVDVYVSDFGKLSIVPNLFQRGRDAWLLDYSMVQIDYLRPFKPVDLAKTGDATKHMVIVEWGLRVKNEKGLGGVFDLATS